MRQVWPIATLLIVFSTVVPNAAAQPTPPPKPETPLILKATTRLVQVNVIALDGKGQPVPDLKKNDFQIKVNGKIQSISAFSVDSIGTLPRGEVTLPSDTFTNRMESRTGNPSSVTIILLDTRNTKFADQMHAKAEIIKYLRTLQPGDHVGLYALGGALRVLHDYTTDATELLSKLDSSKVHELPNTSASEPPDALQEDALLLDSWIRTAGGVSPAERDFYTVDRVLATLRAFEFIANHMAHLPGRKNLIWVSGGFPLEIGFDNLAAWRDPSRDQRTFSAEVDRTVRAINNANMAIYPVDARGLIVDPRFDASRATAPKRLPLSPPIGVQNQAVMQELASRTGGQAYYNTNDLTKAIHDAVDDSRVTYTLGFYPLEENFDGKFHKIEVHVPEPNVKLRYRKGYFDLPEEPQDEQTRMAELRDAVWSPIDSGALGLVAQVRPSKPGSVEIVVKIDHTAISLEPQQDHWVGRLDILFVQRDDRGKQYSGISDTMNLRLGEENYQKLVKDDLVYRKVVERAAQAKVLRIVVRDAASGAIGSITVPLTRGF